MTTPTRTCGECRHFCKRNGHMYCCVPRPACDVLVAALLVSDSWAQSCECFEPKDEKQKGPETT
jgi:hypothetical protein